MIIHVDADVKFSLYLTQHQAMKMKVQVEVQCHSFLNTALDGDELFYLCYSRFTLKTRSPRSSGQEARSASKTGCRQCRACISLLLCAINHAA